MSQVLQSLNVQPEQRLILPGISWQDYLSIDSVMEQVPGVRLTYLQGILEIMTLSSLHERTKIIIRRVLEIYCFAEGIDLHGCGSTTQRDQDAERGLEPDECYCVGSLKPIPDLAIEVIITSGGINKLAVYQGLNVPEIWFWERGEIRVYHLSGDEYQLADRSQFFPDLDLKFFSDYIRPDDQPAAIREFYDRIRD